jgi:hypothetical protein
MFILWLGGLAKLEAILVAALKVSLEYLLLLSHLVLLPYCVAVRSGSSLFQGRDSNRG